MCLNLAATHFEPHTRARCEKAGSHVCKTRPGPMTGPTWQSHVLECKAQSRPCPAVQQHTASSSTVPAAACTHMHREQHTASSGLHTQPLCSCASCGSKLRTVRRCIPTAAYAAAPAPTDSRAERPPQLPRKQHSKGTLTSNTDAAAVWAWPLVLAIKHCSWQMHPIDNKPRASCAGNHGHALKMAHPMRQQQHMQAFTTGCSSIRPPLSLRCITGRRR
jgi:hypothetical protein